MQKAPSARSWWPTRAAPSTPRCKALDRPSLRAWLASRCPRSQARGCHAGAPARQEALSRASPRLTPPWPNPKAVAPELLRLARADRRVDRELLALLNRRAGLALEVGEIKKREGSVVFRPEREAQVIDGLKARTNPGPLQNDSVAPIWREIMSACRALETPTRVAYLGPAGTFSEEAALGFFGAASCACPAPASTK